MGIKSFNKFLRDTVPQVFQKCNLERLANTRLAIDAENLARIYMSIARKQVLKSVDIINDGIYDDMIFRTWLRLVFQTLINFLEHKILPVMVFDGDMIPEKEETCSKRQDKALTRREDIQKIKAQNYISNEDADRLRNLESQNIWIRRDDLTALQDILKCAGIPYFIAFGEAEKLCAQLCIDGYTYATYSKDTDCIALGCPVIVCDKKGNELTIVQLENIESSLGLNYNQIVDLCIMCGCDFNHNIRGIGAKIAYKLLKQYGSIENIIPQKPKLDFKVLKFERCRQIFKPQLLMELLGSQNRSFNLELTKLNTKAHELFKNYNLTDLGLRLAEVEIADIPIYDERTPV